MLISVPLQYTHVHTLKHSRESFIRTSVISFEISDCLLCTSLSGSPLCFWSYNLNDVLLNGLLTKKTV